MSIPDSSHQKKGKKRKDITHDNTREDIKELKTDSSSESLEEIIHTRDAYTKNTTKLETLDLKDEASNDIATVIDLDSGNLYIK